MLRKLVRTRAGGTLDRLQRRLGRSAPATRCAVLLRNQCNRVIRYHLAGGHRQAESGEAWLIQAMGPRVRTFVDVGANVGDWSALLRQHAPDAKGLLFEPGTVAVKRLRARFDPGPGLEIIEAAVGSEPGEADFFEQPDAGEASSMVGAHSGEGSSLRRVRVTTLDAELAHRNIERVDLLKIDAEGYDFEVLRGARKALRDQRVDVIQFEYNRPWASAGATLAGAITFLGECGYRTYLLRDGGLAMIDHEFYGEFFDYANFAALTPAAASVLSS
jgi:FkbM family methyltransferase